MIDTKLFLKGPAGTGKTTSGVAHLLDLAEQTNEGILVYVPQKTLAGPYYEAVQTLDGNRPEILTIGSLARGMVDLYWPLVASDAGFGRPNEQPVFLNLETAQYFIAHVVRPLFEEGFFGSVTINRNRVYTQILDNLNKSALNGYGYQGIGDRLKLAVVGDPEQYRIYQDSQIAAQRFREYCLAHNLLDFSLQLEVFWRHLWLEGSICREYLQRRYQHLIVDNLEETTPIEHDLLRDWLPDFQSATIIYDSEAGYRTFLGADPKSAYQLSHLCDEVVEMTESFVIPSQLEQVGIRFAGALKRKTLHQPKPMELTQLQNVFLVESSRYFPDMLDWAAQSIAELIHQHNVPPNEIVVLTPFLSDALRFSLTNKLERLGVMTRSHRPSRSLRDEPVSQALLTLAMLAHPQWGFHPTRFDIAYMLVQAIDGMDLVRAQLLTEEVFTIRDGTLILAGFGEINPGKQERITYTLGELYEHLRIWLENYQAGDAEALDFFLARIFGEILAQPGFGFHSQLSAGETAANLIDSIRNFRWIAGSDLLSEQPVGKEYIKMLQDGVVAAQYIRSWQLEDEEAVLMAPAYTFLMRNRAVDYQFWLDIGSHGWHERIYQPLTHPYVLNRNWPADRYWTDLEEVETSQETLYRLMVGLMRRCRRQVFLGLSDLSESGYENEGLLLRVLQRIYQQISNETRGQI